MTLSRGQRRPARFIALAALAGGAMIVTGPAHAAATTEKPAVTGVLLPAPGGTSSSVVAVSSLGLLAGRSWVTSTDENGNQVTIDSTAQRWLPVANRYLRQALPKSAGATQTEAASITELGEVGGTTTVGGTTRATLWSVTGRSSRYLGGDRTHVTAGGPNGPWGVTTDDAADVGYFGRLVARNGTVTEITLPDSLRDNIARWSIGSISGPHSARVDVVTGVGRGIGGTPVLWKDGATAALPAFFSIFLENQLCTSEVLTDGTIAYYGLGDPAAGSTFPFGFVAGIHTGGVPGTNTTLEDTDPTSGATTSVACGGEDTVSADGWTGGQSITGAESQAVATLWKGTVPHQLPQRSGDVTSNVAAVAAGGRAVVVADTTAGTQEVYAVHGSTVTPLSLPAGWTYAGVVAYTDRGLVAGNVKNAAGVERPITWHVAG